MARGTVSRLRTECEESFNLKIESAPIPLIARRFASLDRKAKGRMLSLVDQALRSPRILAKESDRVLLARVAVAFAPESAEIIRRSLRKFRGALAYEIHFSLFCFLDQLRGVKRAKGVAAELPAMIRTYLLTVPRETASAAWMAGDLLGDHLPGRSSLLALCAVALKAKHAAGRLGAIHGLQHIVSGAKRATPKHAIAALSHLAHADKNRRVRKSARQALRFPEFG
jgi:hypothetical protein